MTKITVILVAGLAMSGVHQAYAQTATAAATASITIPTLISIDVSNATVSFPSPDLTDYDTGWIGMSSGSSVIQTRANIEHRVTVEADAATMTGPGSKPAGHLQWGVGGAGGTFTGLTTTGADVVTGLVRGEHASAAEVWYRIVLDEAQDEPGTYSLAFTYTALAN